MSKKDIILKYATILFARKGFKNTSMAELSKITGVAEGTIFYHFKNKEEIFLSILENVKNKILNAFIQYDKDTKYDTGLDMMEGIISFYLFLVGQMEDEFLILHRHYPYEFARVNPICRGHIEEIYNGIVDIFEKAIFRGQKDGTISSMHNRKTALIIFSMIDGVARFKTYDLYDASSLYLDLLKICRKMLSASNPPIS